MTTAIHINDFIQKHDARVGVAESELKPLPNDDCHETFRLESEFLTRYLPGQYIYDADNTSTIIVSRSLKTSYIWPKDKPLTVKDLQVFSENGHTLGIDYRSTYCRMFALDLDCACRKTGSSIEHINENVISIVVEKLNALFDQTFKINNAKFSIWKNKCGFHIYTDIAVSMPTHLFLKTQLESNVEFLTQPIVFEVPSIMPLPYSAKNKGLAYKPTVSNHDFDFIPLTIYKERQDCLELFTFQRIALAGRTVAKLTSIIGDEYLVKSQSSSIRRNNPKLVNVSSITLYDDFTYMTQFEEYVLSMVSQFNTHNTALEDINFSEFNEDERLQIRLFMEKINKLFGVPGNQSCDIFIKISALDFGGLYLQPFAAALFLELQFNDYKRFKMLLRKIYHSTMNQYAAIKTFIELVNVQTFQAYAEETSDSIINHLHFLISHNTSPTQTLNEQINSIMEKITDTTADVVRQILQKESKGGNKGQCEVIMMDLMEKFKMIFFEMRILFHDQSCSRYFYLNPITGASYESCAKLNDDVYPSVIRLWIGHSQTATNIMKQMIEKSHDMHISDSVNFTQTEYMYSTRVGVFNSAVGLYTAHTRFLRFNKYRYVSIWPYNVPEKIFFAQNETLLEHYEVVTRFIKIIHENMLDLYAHCIFVPAMIQLRSLISIEERFISQVFSLLSSHKNFECLHFLVEYFQFNPKIVYLIVHLCNEYGGLEIFYSYNILCSKIFQTENASSILWSEKFQNITSQAKYDSTKQTYMEKLESLEGPHIECVPKSTYVFVVLTLACISKCDSFNNFTRAFNIELSKQINPHPRYHDFQYSTSIHSMKSNMVRARSIVFGENLTPFQNTLADELLSICMSANFKPETVVNYLTAVGATFIPINVLKKLLLIQGDGNTGKSLACKKITSIAQPSAGRFEDISAVMKRASVAEYSAVVLNEAYKLNPSQLKIITGNDDTSVSIFYSQKYELQQMQTIMFGATNVHVSFKGTDDVDKTSVLRLYAILFTGKQCPAETNHSSLLSMMVDGFYFSGILSPIYSESVSALRWLSFGMYMSIRDINYFPKLNLSCDTCRDYQHTVYYNNSKLYKFLVDSGIIDAPGFFISKNKLLDIVKQNLDKNGKFSSMSIFKLTFEKQYNISFDKINYVPNFQQIGLIQHIIDNMMVIEEPGSIITQEDIKSRLEMYTLMEHRDNALAYFQRTQEKYYVYDECVYKNIAFTSDICSSYEGNELIPNIIDRDSLVMKSL
ncbi:dnahel [Oryctes rhinoceros nudivirus]|uniref:Dnahel n=1 Tax=Oryctes rhinoceros nudivirus TaxID=92521 RepID=A0A7D3UI93_9VIRU|nr:dnahel [Oryctes rhinoceros nudivirus]ACH96164.1 dnahel [Oryctes rhinoceros nudivirus]QKE59507.1 dnahel [Oryctes rhinoceros nudivirus]UBO76454.1 DNAhel [Oryctes rhinoceros nudivirus]UBR58215.1 DNA helicase [Oryctes rhinoceros nudivirus]WAQ80213.1 dnahel [Oryctes rhinoceros nudivirus]